MTSKNTFLFLHDADNDVFSFFFSSLLHKFSCHSSMKKKSVLIVWCNWFFFFTQKKNIKVSRSANDDDERNFNEINYKIIKFFMSMKKLVNAYNFLFLLLIITITNQPSLSA